MNLSDRAMLVTLHIHVWTARKYDQKISDEVATQHSAISDDVGRYNKKLMPQSAKSYHGVRLIGQRIRAYHDEQTLPWGENGVRILPAANFMDYTNEMRTMRADFESGTSSFFAEYPALRQHAKSVLNGMYDPEDYPSEIEIKDKFGIDFAIYPMPDEQDFRVELGDEQVALIRDQITRQVESASQLAMRDLWKRLYDVVGAMTVKLSSPDAVFRDSLLSNIHSLCSLLPKLNITNDANLEAMRQQIANDLGRHLPDALREDKTLRAAVAKKAAEIQTTMAAYMEGL